MPNTIFKYGLALAVGVFALQWLEYQYVIRTLPTEAYVIVIAVVFTALGLLLGRTLTTPKMVAPFQKNIRALEYLEISVREYQMLELIAKGHSNEEIAKQLFLSGNTIKTHLASLYRKLEVSRRTLAIQKSRSLRLIP